MIEEGGLQSYFRETKTHAQAAPGTEEGWSRAAWALLRVSFVYGTGGSEFPDEN